MCFICPLYPYFLSMGKVILSMGKVVLSMDKVILSMDKIWQIKTLSMDKIFLSMDRIFLSLNKIFLSVDKIFLSEDRDNFFMNKLLIVHPIIFVLVHVCYSFRKCPMKIWLHFELLEHYLTKKFWNWTGLDFYGQLLFTGPKGSLTK